MILFPKKKEYFIWKIEIIQKKFVLIVLYHKIIIE